MINKYTRAILIGNKGVHYYKLLKKYTGTSYKEYLLVIS